MSEVTARTPLDIDSLIQRIKQIARERGWALEGMGEVVRDTPEPGNGWTIKTPLQRFAERREYVFTEFLAGSAEECVTRAYWGILKRPPDPAGFQSYLEFLKSGGSRVFMLTAMLWSPEGQKAGVKIAGVEWLRRHALFRNERVRRILCRLMDIVSRPGLYMQMGLMAVENEIHDTLSQWRAELLGSQQVLRKDCQRAAEQTASTLRARLAEMGNSVEMQGNRLKTLREELDKLMATNQLFGNKTTTLDAALTELKNGWESRFDRHQESQRETLQALTDKQERLASALEECTRQCSELSERLAFLTRDLTDHKFTVDAFIRNLERGTEPKPEGAAVRDAVREFRSMELDNYYIAFEDVFRGEPAKIKDQFREYLTYLRNARAATAEHPLLDLGCGRGEWLELLRENGMVGKGIDTNRLMIQECKDRHLDCEVGDAIAFIENAPACSFSAVTAFHLIEHLPFEDLFTLCRHAFRVLKNVGIVIFETPNPENLLVSSYTFYHDPTHRHPITPVSIDFLLRYSGFARTEILRLHPYPPEAKVPGDDPVTQRVNGHFCGPQDFAVIAYKYSAS